MNGTKVADRTRSQCTAGRITIQVAPFSRTSPSVVDLFSAAFRARRIVPDVLFAIKCFPDDSLRDRGAAIALAGRER